MPGLPHTNSQDPLRPGVQRGVCHDRKAFLRKPATGYLSIPVHAARRRGIALIQHAARRFPSKAASREIGASDSPSARVRPVLACRHSNAAAAFRQARQLPRSAEFRKPHLCRLPFRETPCSAGTRHSSPALTCFIEASCVLSWTPLFSVRAMAHTSRRPWQRRPYMAHNRLRACVKFVVPRSLFRLFGAQRARAAASYRRRLRSETQAALLPDTARILRRIRAQHAALHELRNFLHPQATAISGQQTLPDCDLFWPEASIAVEYQSREFHSGDLCHALRFATDERLQAAWASPSSDDQQRARKR